MMNRIIVFLIVWCCSGSLFGNQVRVRILSTLKVEQLNVSNAQGGFSVYMDTLKLVDSLAAKVIRVQAVGDSLELLAPGVSLGKCSKLYWRINSDSSVFKIKPLKPMNGTRSYQGSLSIRAVGGLLECITVAELENYVGGVVESESGGKTPLEFYKVQAILCRTYALSHLNRHGLEGFDVCDGVHCQVYKSRTVDPVVLEGVTQTAGQVVVDRNLIMITAAFHSNCGGQTANSEDVWGASVSYLRSIRDTFCIRSSQAYWTRKIAKDDWLSYLQLKHKYPVQDSMASYSALNMTQEQRTTNYVYGNYRIPYKTIRSDWQLKSAYFSIEERNDSIVIRGRGYGHGVGLCQEGAISMAKRGYKYDQIIKYYYRNVEIVHLSRLWFFREE